MAGTPQRLRYFDGEFLRSNDFTDEQTYHVAVRRQLNKALHLSGVVSGLEVEKDQDSLPNLAFFSVSPGFAIDQFGREIVVPAPFPLSADTVLGRAGLQEGGNEVWIVYTEQQTGLPAAGYRLCDQPDQNTRWAESFDVLLKPKDGTLAKGAKDPDKDLGGIRLGTVRLKNDTINGWTIIDPPDRLGRSYVGITAQSVVPPDTLSPDVFKLAEQTVTPPGSPPAGYIEIGAGIFVPGNAFLQKNAVIGDDFSLANTSPPGPAPKPSKDVGNLKLGSDVFVTGKIYTFVGGNWVALSDFVNLLPDIRFATVHVTVTTLGTDTTSPIPVATGLPTFSTVTVQATIAGYSFVPLTDINAFLTKSVTGDPGISLHATAIPAADKKSADVTVTWDVGGGWIDGGSNHHFLFSSIDVALMVVFRP